MGSYRIAVSRLTPAHGLRRRNGIGGVRSGAGLAEGQVGDAETAAISNGGIDTLLEGARPVDPEPVWTA